MTLTDTGYTITRVGGALGARVDGLDLSMPIPDATMAALRSALYEHCVLVFAGQSHLTSSEQLAFGRNWGELIKMPPGVPLVDGNSELFSLYAPAGTGDLGGPRWHSDWTFLEQPLFVSLLLARKLPSAGGDTMWANQYLAYEMLSPTLRTVLDGLKAVHIRRKVLKSADGEVRAPQSAVHPVVRTIPETGRRALFVNPYYTAHFDGMSIDESRGLLQFLYEHSTQPNLTFRHQWSPGDLVMWDNRGVQHCAIQDYDEEREMHRLSIVGERPVFA